MASIIFGVDPRADRVVTDQFRALLRSFESCYGLFCRHNRRARPSQHCHFVPSRPKPSSEARYSQGPLPWLNGLRDLMLCLLIAHIARISCGAGHRSTAE